MNIVIDIETDKLVNPKHVWVISCLDIDTNTKHIFRNLTEDINEKNRFIDFAKKVNKYIGHNILGFDANVLNTFFNIHISGLLSDTVDTLVISKLVNYPREGHSIEDYGLEFGIEKLDFVDFSKYSEDLEQYCIRDTEICARIYNKYKKIILDPKWADAINLEQQFQLITNDLNKNGFYFNKKKAEDLLEKVNKQLSDLDVDIHKQFPPRLKLVREIHPRITKHGTLNKSDFRWIKDGDLSAYNGGPFCRCVWEPFNPSSHKQIVDVLHLAGWSPTDKTKTHIETEKKINKLKYTKNKTKTIDTELQLLYNNYNKLKKYGWKINEINLSTLPPEAPSSARTLAKRILVEARRRTLVEWLGLVNPDTNRVHGKFYGIGAWTHRMAHQSPNMANIPNQTDTNGNVRLLGKEMRSLWQAPPKRLLVGVDAESIQLRIFAHYIDDAEFTNSIVNGKKKDKTDPHSLNQSILGDVCKTRAAAKRFIYALLLGAGLDKLSEILNCSTHECRTALDRLMQRYKGFAELKQTIIPRDASRGYFTGLDGRLVKIPGNTESERRHLCMSGYLQNGEAVIMKRACLRWYKQLQQDPDIANTNWKLVNFVHDEWQTETNRNVDIALKIAKIQSDSLAAVGEELKLKCPLAGSYWNDDIEDYTIGTNWAQTH